MSGQTPEEIMLAELDKQEQWIQAMLIDHDREEAALKGKMEMIQHLRARIKSGQIPFPKDITS